MIKTEILFESENCKYNVILGADFLTKTGIDVKYSTNTIEWFENELPLRDPHLLKDEDFASMATIIEIQQEVEFFGMDWYDQNCYAIKILDAKYESVQILSWKCCRHVVTCRHDTSVLLQFGQMGPCHQHRIEDVVAVCVGLSRHIPNF